MRVTDPEADGLVLNSAWTNKIALLMMILGIISILFPLFVAVTSILLFGWVFIFAGISQILYALQSRNSGQVVWKTILGLLYLLAGIFLVTNPLEGVIAFTVVLGITIFVQGIIQVSIALQMRRSSLNWEWMLASGIIGIIFGIFVWSNFPLGAAWLIGILIGINLLFDGFWMLTFHSGRRGTLD